MSTVLDKMNITRLFTRDAFLIIDEFGPMIMAVVLASNADEALDVYLSTHRDKENPYRQDEYLTDKRRDEYRVTHIDAIEKV